MFDNAHHLLAAALKVAPIEDHPPRPFHGGGPAPKVDASAYAHATLWLATRVEPLLDVRDRDTFDRHVAAARAELAAPRADPGRLTMLRLADAKTSSRVPCKVALWAACEAFNATTRSIYAGTPTRAAASNVTKLLVKKRPDTVRAFLAALDALCVHLDALTALRAKDQAPPTRAISTPFRGLTGGKPTHYVLALEDGGYCLFGKIGSRWQLVPGDRDTVLATLPDELFPAAVRAVCG